MTDWQDFRPRLVATDIDGTILPHGGTVSARTTAALERSAAAGLDVVLVTGRPPRWLPPVLEATGLTGPVISANGAVVVDAPSLELIEVWPIAPEVARATVERLLLAVPDAVFAAETPDGLRVGPGYGRVRESGRREGLAPDTSGVTVVDTVEEMLDVAPIIKIVAVSPGSMPDALLRTGREQVGDLVSVTMSSIGRAMLELGPPGVTKASTLAWFAESRGTTTAEAVAFGDMPNDSAMLQAVGRGYAMDGGHAEAVAAADAVAPPAHEDGVAQVLEAMLAARPPALAEAAPAATTLDR